MESETKLHFCNEFFRKQKLIYIQQNRVVPAFNASNWLDTKKYIHRLAVTDIVTSPPIHFFHNAFLHYRQTKHAPGDRDTIKNTGSSQK